MKDKRSTRSTFAYEDKVIKMLGSEFVYNSYKDEPSICVPIDSKLLQDVMEYNSTKALITALNMAGFKLEVVKGDYKEDDKSLDMYRRVDYLSIRVDDEKFSKTVNRFAGKKEKIIKYYELDGTIIYVCYSDIIIMSTTMSDNEIIKGLNCSTATYYRKKKKMMESDFYKQVDWSITDDKEFKQHIESIKSKGYSDLPL